ncbi:hypothetical protein J437_LFUL009155 [Ladona fulva]|uniref:Uncharacterized protein n=1 Tax=Ladona fulva TaxID=123851 RepID=A0A8K0KIN7_LADFU|nr:hypothetical protein J437_LFUL009155 [Ladona fulva]
MVENLTKKYGKLMVNVTSYRRKNFAKNIYDFISVRSNSLLIVLKWMIVISTNDLLCGQVMLRFKKSERRFQH